MRACGCNDRGRHQRECTLHISNKKLDLVFGEEAYVAPIIPHIEWSSTKTRQTTVENRIRTFVRRRKSFYLTVDDKYDWYVSNGSYVFWTKEASNTYGYETSTQKKSGIGAIGNILPFFSGYRGDLGIAFESWVSPSYALDRHAKNCSGATCAWNHGVKLGEPDPTKKRRHRTKKVGV